MGPVAERGTTATTAPSPTTATTATPYSTDPKEAALYQAELSRARLPQSERGLSAAILPTTIPSTRASGD